MVSVQYPKPKHLTRPAFLHNMGHRFRKLYKEPLTYRSYNKKQEISILEWFWISGYMISKINNKEAPLG
jgi:hypothetical protein